MRSAFVALLALILSLSARAEMDTLRLGVQPGLTYLPFAVVQHEGLIEKEATAVALINADPARPRGYTWTSRASGRRWPRFWR